MARKRRPSFRFKTTVNLDRFFQGIGSCDISDWTTEKYGRAYRKFYNPNALWDWDWDGFKVYIKFRYKRDLTMFKLTWK